MPRSPVVAQSIVVAVPQFKVPLQHAQNMDQNVVLMVAGIFTRHPDLSWNLLVEYAYDGPLSERFAQPSQSFELHAHAGELNKWMSCRYMRGVLSMANHQTLRVSGPCMEHPTISYCASTSAKHCTALG